MCPGKEANGHYKLPVKDGNIRENGVISESKLNMYACTCVVAASVISAIFGYVSGVMAGALLFIKDELGINDTQVQLLAGILNAFALPGSLVAGRTSDCIGRRNTIILSSIIFLLGSILMGYGPNFPVLMIGRCTTGFGVGFALMIAPLYSAEISSPSYRGFLTALPDVSINLGLLLGYVSSYVFGNLPLRLGWRMMLAIPAIPSLGLAILMLKLVESPRWLVMQGRVAEAREVLLLVSNTKHEAEQRLEEIKVAAGIIGDGDDDDRKKCGEDDDVLQIEKRSSCSGGGALRELLCNPSPPVRRILIASTGVHLFQQLSGMEAILVYTPRIFERTGITDKNMLLLANVGMGVSDVVFILILTFMLDKVGRRIFLLVSSGGMAVSLLGLGACMTIVEHSSVQVPWAINFTIVFTYMMVAFMAIGLGPVTWVYSSEIFPLRLRAQGIGLGVTVNRLTNVGVMTSYITIYQKITMAGSFFLFGGITIIAWTFYYFLPETKGRSLEDMEALFGKTTSKTHMPLKRGCNNNNSYYNA